MEPWIVCYALLTMWFSSVRILLCNPASLEESLDSSAFPNNFLFGTASSSYQFEGAYLAHGKGLSNWDVFTHRSGNIKDGTNGDIAVDQYHKYMDWMLGLGGVSDLVLVSGFIKRTDDLDLMECIGVSSYRFSISWARIIPKGRFGNMNRDGITYYNSLINALLDRGIEPFVTLTHYDIPQELEDRYGAWLSPEVEKDFKYYADICFKSFGDRVKYWATFNEPNVAVIRGYRSGMYPPARCSGSFGNCSSGDSEREPFVAAHNMILSHMAAIRVYRTKYQKNQGGSIGIVMNALWFEPISNSPDHTRAAERAQAFYMNWFLDPIVHGKYPAEMQEILGSVLPSFSRHENQKLEIGLDFIGINHYSSFYVKDCLFASCDEGPEVSKSKGYTSWTSEKDGIPIGPPTAIEWLHVYPDGMEKIVTYIKERYNNTPMFITENGFGDDEENQNSTTEVLLNDVKRVKYMSSYLDALQTAVRKGADIRGYFSWSLLDNFEWTDGYTIRFGLYHVDHTNLKRKEKLSANWYKEYIANYPAHRNHATSLQCQMPPAALTRYWKKNIIVLFGQGILHFCSCVIKLIHDFLPNW